MGALAWHALPELTTRFRQASRFAPCALLELTARRPQRTAQTALPTRTLPQSRKTSPTVIATLVTPGPGERLARLARLARTSRLPDRQFVTLALQIPILEPLHRLIRRTASLVPRILEPMDRLKGRSRQIASATPATLALTAHHARHAQRAPTRL